MWEAQGSELTLVSGNTSGALKGRQGIAQGFSPGFRECSEGAL